MTYKTQVAVCSKIRTKHSTQSEHHVEFLIVKPGGVGLVARYELDGPVIEFRWGRDFSHASIPALGPTQPPVQWVLGLSRG
jgi:hypothetical protein